MDTILTAEAASPSPKEFGPFERVNPQNRHPPRTGIQVALEEREFPVAIGKDTNNNPVGHITLLDVGYHPTRIISRGDPRYRSTYYISRLLGVRPPLPASLHIHPRFRRADQERHREMLWKLIQMAEIRDGLGSEALGNRNNSKLPLWFNDQKDNLSFQLPVVGEVRWVSVNRRPCLVLISPVGEARTTEEAVRGGLGRLPIRNFRGVRYIMKGALREQSYRGGFQGYLTYADYPIYIPFAENPIYRHSAFIFVPDTDPSGYGRRLPGVLRRALINSGVGVVEYHNGNKWYPLTEEEYEAYVKISSTQLVD